jgi:hypothetical protein
MIDRGRGASLLDLLEHPDPSVALALLCASSLDRLRMTGVAVSAVVGTEPLGVLAAAGTGVEELERQWAGIEGPAADAHRTATTIESPDLARGAPWASYAADAVRLGVCAVFALPLRIGATGYGALVLGRRSPGAPSAGEWAEAKLSSDVASLLVVAIEAKAGAGDPIGNVGDLMELRLVVHQAAGMVSVQLDIDVMEAHLVLRTRAWVLGQSLTDVSRDVVGRQLRFSQPGLDPT